MWRKPVNAKRRRERPSFLAMPKHVIILTQFAAAQDDARPEGKYIMQKMIEAQGGVKFSLPKTGNFTVEEVQLTDNPKTACHVSMQSLGNTIEQGVANGSLDLSTGVKKTIKLKAHSFPDGHILCYGGGTQCKVKVNVNKLF